MTEGPDLATLGVRARSVRPIGGGDTCRAWRAELVDGSSAFVKRTPAGAVGMADLEAAGLTWLARSGAAAPEVLAVGPDVLVLRWVDASSPSRAAAAACGQMLARLHQTTTPTFGVAPPGAGNPAFGWVGKVRVPFGEHESWPEHYVHDRLQPALAAATANGGVDSRMTAAIDDLCDALLRHPEVAGPAVAPAPIHGDLWSGNVMWQSEGTLLIDPAACGGHPETDLAMLHRFGAPHLEGIIAAYSATRPLPSGWVRRIPLHQVFPLLVHAAMFGLGYGEQAAQAARAAVAVRS